MEVAIRGDEAKDAISYKPSPLRFNTLARKLFSCHKAIVFILKQNTDRNPLVHTELYNARVTKFNYNGITSLT